MFRCQLPGYIEGPVVPLAPPLDCGDHDVLRGMFPANEFKDVHLSISSVLQQGSAQTVRNHFCQSFAKDPVLVEQARTSI